jgi:hypothetical protein
MGKWTPVRMKHEMNECMHGWEIAIEKKGKKELPRASLFKTLSA